MHSNNNFGDYLGELKESLQLLALYWDQIGYDSPHLDSIQHGLTHPDPFVVYNASIAATLLLNDESIYH